MAIEFTKQQLAQKRNYFKYVIIGMCKPVDVECLSGPEKFAWNQILKHRQVLIEEFDKHSRELGLKVPEFRCWCGKEGKYKPEYENYQGAIKVCKKHITIE
tara:strand:- start:692 stop:994 length:303 start_codon:yes stop_codon:yes gene_type:complete